MTPKQEAIKKRFLDYGFMRHCSCYHGRCLVVPESLVDEMVMRIYKVLEGGDRMETYNEYVKRRGGKKE